MHFQFLHFFLKQGLQGRELLKILYLPAQGPVLSGEVGPKKAMVGFLKAEAICIGPVSTLTTALESFIKIESSFKDNFPTKE